MLESLQGVGHHCPIRMVEQVKAQLVNGGKFVGDGFWVNQLVLISPPAGQVMDNLPGNQQETNQLMGLVSVSAA